MGIIRNSSSNDQQYVSQFLIHLVLFFHVNTSPSFPLYIARAPGRLDLMGGIADYSGKSSYSLNTLDDIYSSIYYTSNVHERFLQAQQCWR